MPPLTQTLGPWLADSDGKYASRLGQQKDSMFELIERLPPFDYFCQNWHYSVTNWLPFRWKGFTCTTNYTYLLEDLSDLDRVWSGFKDKLRAHIRNAERHLHIRDDLGIDVLLQTIAGTFRRQGLGLPYDRSLIESLARVCTARQTGRAFFAVDDSDRCHAAAYLVWDARSAYYLLGGADPDLRHAGAMSLLLWRVIQFAATVSSRFDFEGSMLEPVEHFVRSFGAVQRPYFNIRGCSRRMRAAQALRELWNCVRGR